MIAFARLWAATSGCALLILGIASITNPGVAFADAAASVVTIYAYSGDKSSNQGTGFVISASGHIVTAYHVVQDSTEIEVFDESFDRLAKPTIEWLDSERDIAVLHVTANKQLPYLRLSKAVPEKPDDVRIVGSPRGLPKQVLFGKTTSYGYVSSLQLRSAGGGRIFAKDIQVLPVDVTIYSGMSGAPIIAQDDTVVGLLSGSFDDGRGVGWAIPSKYIQELMESQPVPNSPGTMLNWPALSLMGGQWVSLKRSYDHKLTSNHLAQLEALEGGLRDLKGTWTRHDEERIVQYDDSLGRCEKVMATEEELNVNSIDVADARLVGSHRLRLSISVSFTDSPQSYDNDSMRQFRASLCNSRVFGDKLKTSSEGVLSGSVAIGTRIGKRRSSAAPPLRAVVFVDDCKGDGCTADVYGNQDWGVIESISDAKIRWHDSILTR